MQMLVDNERRCVLSHGGWGDDYRWLWRYNLDTGEEQRLEQFDGRFGLFGTDDNTHLLVVEHDRRRCTIRALSEPTTARASAIYDGTRWAFDGEPALRDQMPRYVMSASQLLHVAPQDVEPDPLAWYTDDAYDLGYQGVHDPVEIPGSHLLVIPVQRDSRPVLYDPDTRTVVGHLNLADRGGNPSLYFRRTADELWVDDYDTLLRLRPGTWELLDVLRLQEGTGSGSRQFIGDFWFPPDERICIVCRPFSGDIVLLDPATFREVGAVATGRQPLDAVLLDDGTVIARDWQTREVLTAHTDC